MKWQVGDETHPTPSFYPRLLVVLTYLALISLKILQPSLYWKFVLESKSYDRMIVRQCGCAILLKLTTKWDNNATLEFDHSGVRIVQPFRKREVLPWLNCFEPLWSYCFVNIPFKAFLVQFYVQSTLGSSPNAMKGLWTLNDVVSFNPFSSNNVGKL